MFSLAIFKRTFRQNVKILVSITLILTILFIVMGISSARIGSISAIMIQQFYSLFATLIPLIFIGSVSNRLIASQVDDGSLVYSLSSKIRRNQFVFTQGVFLYGSVIIMFAILTVVGVILCYTTDIDITIKQIMLLNLGSLLFNLAISGIGFFASSTFNNIRWSGIIGTGLPIMFLVLSMVSGLSTINADFEFAKYLTINSLYNMDHIMTSSLNIIWEFSVLVLLAFAGFIGGMMIFDKKDLPL